MICNSKPGIHDSAHAFSHKAVYARAVMDDADKTEMAGLAGLFDAVEAGSGAPELSLRGLRLEDAAPLLEAALQAKTAGEWLAIRFDSPQPGGGQSLFQPVGRRLRGALRDGRIDLCRPLPPDAGAPAAGFGFVIRFA